MAPEVKGDGTVVKSHTSVAFCATNSLVTRLFCLIACVSTACAKPATQAPIAGPPPAASAEVPVIADDAGWPLTEAKVVAWLAYQRLMMARTDAGALDRARRERALRTDAGLSEDEVDRIEDVVAAIVTQRNLARLTGSEAVRQFEQATAALTPAQRAKAEQAMADLRARSAQATSLDAEKARFGADAVNAVLAHEAEATKTWDTLVEAKEPR